MNSMDPDFFFKFCTVAVFLVGLAVNIKALRKQDSIQKREISFAESFASDADLKELRQDVMERIARTDAAIVALKESIVKNGEDRKKAIEDKVEAARNEARGESKEIRDELASMGVRLAAIATTADNTATQVALLLQHQRRKS